MPGEYSSQSIFIPHVEREIFSAKILFPSKGLQHDFFFCKILCLKHGIQCAQVPANVDEMMPSSPLI